MAEENRSAPGQASPGAADPVEAVKERADGSTSPASTEREPESETGRLLREAIQKVMEQINLHEREAKKHLQQAAELRKDLRESIAFLAEQGEKSSGKRMALPTPAERPADMAEANRHPRSKAKKRGRPGKA
jgi:hypothetical protein